MLDNYELLVNTTALAIQANIPVHIQGMPGIGKTQILGMIARSLDAELFVLLGSISDPTDFGGFPMPTEEGVRMMPKTWVKRLNALRSQNKRAILFLDEITTVPPMVQAAMLRVVCERYVGEEQLGDHISIGLASNPPEIAASGQNIAPPLANRMMHLEFEIDHTRWCEGVIMGFPDVKFPTLPADWKDRYYQTNAIKVAAFIKRGGREKLVNLPKNSSDQSKAWPSARTWDMAISALAACEAVGASRQVRTNMLSGLIGNGVAIEYVEYEENLNLPDPEEILRNPRGFRLPTESDRAYAAANSIMAAVLSNNTKDRWTAGMTALAASAKGREDIVTAPCRALLEPGKKPEGATLPPEFKDMYDMFAAAGMVSGRAKDTKAKGRKTA